MPFCNILSRNVAVVFDGLDKTIVSHYREKYNRQHSRFGVSDSVGLSVLDLTLFAVRHQRNRMLLNNRQHPVR